MRPHPYTAVFSYGYRDSANVLRGRTTGFRADLTAIVAVRVRLIIDANLNHAPTPIDVVTTVLPRNAVPY